ncbi:uncharacterized protein LOC109863180 isoform X2 [Pseudomyrmex gracilis]|uniref:uncharacterized protein LOC109863180 isoform X2 n=1 Tax=Pseudomyrmex gracilis TaxID=219809 RepID=UPI000994AFC6|nr:uncharacterized protein LOC109863180 isoform X2 [Pseudomyrmex gracilis]
MIVEMIVEAYIKITKLFIVFINLVINNNPSDNSSNFQDTDGSLKSSESSTFSKSKNRHTLTLNLNRKESKKRKENYGNYKRIQNVISSDSESEENEGNHNSHKKEFEHTGKLLENKKKREELSCRFENSSNHYFQPDELIKHDKNSKKHLNVMSVADSRLTYLKGKNDDPLRVFIANYIDARINKLEEKLLSKIESIKRSILHDIDKHMGKLNVIVANSNRIECADIPSLRNILPDLPIKNLEDFLKFEEELALTNQGNKESPEDTPDYYSGLEKQNALKL